MMMKKKKKKKLIILEKEIQKREKNITKVYINLENGF